MHVGNTPRWQRHAKQVLIVPMCSRDCGCTCCCAQVPQGGQCAAAPSVAQCEEGVRPGLLQHAAAASPCCRECDSWGDSPMVGAPPAGWPPPPSWLAPQAPRRCSAWHAI